MSWMDELEAFPRPDRARENTTLLCGEWAFEYDPDDTGLSSRWFESPRFSRNIEVPFCVESDSSGIGDPNPPRVVWYAREFDRPGATAGDRTLLHFGAVDYLAEAWLNGHRLGIHEGGYTPFSFDVTGALEEKNLLVVRVEDRRSPHIPRGKQTLLRKPFLIFYPGVTGIWQPVWLEQAGEAYLESYRAVTADGGRRLELNCRMAAGSTGVLTVELVSPDGDVIVGEAELEPGPGDPEVELVLEPGNPHLWSVDEPWLYGLRITARTGSSTDVVRGYVGIRTIEARGKDVLLNGEPLYQKLLLCQGYYPGGHYTPSGPQEFKRDIELVRSMGFNGVRIHQKVEDPRFLYYCDRLGCLAWEEMPSAYRFSSGMRAALEAQWAEVIERDFNHPSIIARVPFNESWGVGLFPFPFNVRKKTVEYVKRVCRITGALDPTRPVIDNSGYEHTSETDIVDIHHYLSDAERCRKLYDELESPGRLKWSALRLLAGAVPGKQSQNPFARGERYAGQPVMISEYGGFGFYRTGEERPLLESYGEYTDLIRKRENLKGYCYTQLYDTYQEKNGLLTFDRTPKVDVDAIREIND